MTERLRQASDATPTPIPGAYERGMPGTVTLAVVAGLLITLVWGFAAVVMGALLVDYGGGGWLSALAVGLACVFNGVGIVGIFRRWEWVRWAALVQSVVFVVIFCMWMAWFLFTPYLVALFVLHAVLQLLPPSARWFRYRPSPPRW